MTHMSIKFISAKFPINVLAQPSINSFGCPTTQRWQIFRVQHIHRMRIRLGSNTNTCIVVHHTCGMVARPMPFAFEIFIFIWIGKKGCCHYVSDGVGPWVLISPFSESHFSKLQISHSIIAISSPFRFMANVINTDCHACYASPAMDCWPGSPFII